MTTPQFSPITVTTNPDMQQDYIARQVDSCPPHMMVTELVRNGIQADHATGDVRIVRIFERPVLIPFSELSEDQVATAKNLQEYGYKVTTEGVWVPKLAIWNTGKGMDAAKLRRITHIGQTEDKKFGISHSFGMGGKLASLGNNPLGVRYQSCANGKVSQITLTLAKDPATGKTFYAHKLVDGKEVTDVTDVVKKESKSVKPIPANRYLKVPAQQEISFMRDISSDWTEVVLMGSHPLQQTAIHPSRHDESFYLVGPRNEQRLWIGDDLWQRWFDFEAVVRRALDDSRKGEKTEVSIDVSVRLLRAPLRTHGKTKTGDFRTFRSVSETFDRAWGEKFYTQSEVVTAPDGTTIYYGYDNSESQQHYQFGDTRSMFAIVLGGEMFEVERYGAPKEGRRWSLVAPKFGITEPSLAKKTSIIVCLPDSCPVRMSDNRDHLIHVGSSLKYTQDDIAAVVRDNMPDWLQKLNEPKEVDSDEKFNEYMKDYLRELLRDAPPPVQASNGTSSLSLGGSQRMPPGGSKGNASGASKPRSQTTSQTANLGAPPNLIPPRLTLPSFHWVNSEAATAHGIENRFARYDRHAHVLYLNPKYHSMSKTIEKVREGVPDLLQGDPEKVGDLILMATKEFYKKVVIKYVLRLIVRNYSKDLDGWDEAAHPTAITTMVDCADTAVRDIIHSMKSGQYKGQYFQIMRSIKPFSPTAKAS
jgi:hypothetical protein